ncbi:MULTISPECIES: VTT domain-containing protein [Actinoplanes]|uniref:DedA family protein n=1 Tax=Actinoplanes TaxID=1865 RepID=UPI0005F2BA02|nr:MULTISPECIES: VTT domain-containing protein [Actinoplanes]GLY00420.1 hypothetical protein Acsp01_07990 [Actinoplanes sp. NBRC 101535]
MDPTQAYAMLGPLVLLEGPVATVTAGSLVGAGLLRFWPAWLIVVAAEVLGDSLLWLLGRWGRHPRVRPLLARLGMTDARRDRFTAAVARSLPRMVITAKLVDVVALPAFVAAGLAGVRFGRFAALVTAAAAVRASVLVGLGAAAGAHLTGLLARPGGFLLVTAVVAVPVALVLLTIRLREKRHERRHACASSSAPTPTPRTSTALPTSRSGSPAR